LTLRVEACNRVIDSRRQLEWFNHVDRKELSSLMRREPERSAVSCVLVGSFNPVIFHPAWFVANGLLESMEIDAAEIKLVHPEFSAFSTEWLSLQVERTRFRAVTHEAPFIRLMDLVTRTFDECLVHTPLRMLGINRSVHFSVRDEATRNRIGKRLAPHEPWKEWGKMIEGDSPEKRGGLRSLTMEQRNLADREKGSIGVKIEPSTQLNNQAGIFVEVNDHYEAKDAEQNQGAQEIMEILKRQFDVSIRKSEWIIDQIMSLAEDCQ
jgi:hypothetical protein